MANPNPSKPFTKNDKRINRDGRPKDAVSLAALVRRIGHEVATTKDGKPVIGPDGKPMTVVEVILRQKAQSVKGQAEFLDRGWGKVATPVDITSKGERITGYAGVNPDDWDGDASESAA
jgi:hypothetical protein